MPGVAVDGQNVEAVFEVANAAAQRARAGQGPTLIEAKTYRFDEHSVRLFVPGKPYRTADEVERHKQSRDPVKLFAQALLNAGFDSAEMTRIETEVAQAVAEAIAYAEASELPDPATLYDYMYSNPIGYPVHRPA
jgi:acetoin:2,6-dichlorophenolindophenol oxidoreductase subunit alpha